MDLQKQAEQAEQAVRTADGRFAKGSSGNPAGRPPGLRNHATRIAEFVLDGAAEALTQKAVDLALEGNPVALRLCLERIVATRRDRPVPVPMPALGKPVDVASALDAITAAVAEGEITPREAVALGRFVDTLLRLGVMRWPRTDPPEP
jgi:hypothetical protein